MTALRRTAAACARAPGKVILLGEHAVVYGRRALAAAIARHVEVRIRPAGATQDIPAAPLAAALERAAALIGLQSARFAAEISADLPAGAGLGSSAALSVALVRALAAFAGQGLADAAVCAHAFEIEKIFHGFPSGIDNTVATWGGLVAFQRGCAVRRVTAARPIPLVIALGRVPRQTQQTVRALRYGWETHPEHYEPLFDDIDRLVQHAEECVTAGDFTTLGLLMNANQSRLRRLGVSTAELDTMVALARAHGALGAKLTGGGGGGAMICLCVDDREPLVRAFERAGWSAFATDLCLSGVRRRSGS